MTYGCMQSFASGKYLRRGAAVSHSAELVRGPSPPKNKAPSSGPSDHLLPKGRRGHCHGEHHCLRAAFTSASGKTYLAPSSYLQFFRLPTLPFLVVSPTQAPKVD
jgi:hypothetical protein